MLNAIELAWCGLKNFVRKRSTSFRHSNVRHLAQQSISVLSADDSIAYVNRSLRIEETFKKFDRFIQQIEEDIIDEDDDGVSLEEESALD